MKFKYLDDIATADIALMAEGSTLEEAFSNAALGMFNIITSSVKKIKIESEKYVKIESEDLRSLLYDWLDKLLFYWDTEGLVFSKYDIKISKNEKYELVGYVFGGKPKIHEIDRSIKAVTYHMMNIEKKGKKYVIRVVFDL
jgi:SHS2 domain-containing protein